MPSSGTDRNFRVEWHGDKEDDSRNVTQVFAILQEHVCDGKSQAVSVTSRDTFNSAQYPTHFSAKLSSRPTVWLWQSLLQKWLCRTQGAFTIRFVVFSLQDVMLKVTGAAMLCMHLVKSLYR